MLLIELNHVYLSDVIIHFNKIFLVSRELSEVLSLIINSVKSQMITALSPHLTNTGPDTQ